MLDSIKEYLEDSMERIPSGVENIRNYKDNKKWISSNSQMSIPRSKGNMDETQKEVKIDSFYIAKYPVTEGLYDSITKNIPIDIYDESNSTPIVNISWIDTIHFCNMFSKESGLKECYSFIDESVYCDFSANGYRLPTDSEWQYACKAGVNKYQYDKIEKIAWYQENSEGRVHIVGLKEPNKFGLYDMLGNVWEWCWDLYDEETYGSYRIFRGGSWASEERECGATCRRRSHPEFSIDDLGFRIVKSI